MWTGKGNLVARQTLLTGVCDNVVYVLRLARLYWLDFFLKTSLAEARGLFLAAHEAHIRREQTPARRT